MNNAIMLYFLWVSYSEPYEACCDWRKKLNLMKMKKVLRIICQILNLICVVLLCAVYLKKLYMSRSQEAVLWVTFCFEWIGLTWTFTDKQSRRSKYISTAIFLVCAIFFVVSAIVGPFY